MISTFERRHTQTKKRAARPDGLVYSLELPAQSGLALPTLWSTVYYGLVLREFDAERQPGRLLFNPPDRMQLGRTERVEVLLTRRLKLEAELLKHLRGQGIPRLEEISTTPLIAVTLKGDGFRITPYSDEEQRVIAADLLADLTAVDAKLKALTAELRATLTRRGSRLMDLFGMGLAGAARILVVLPKLPRTGRCAR